MAQEKYTRGGAISLYILQRRAEPNVDENPPRGEPAASLY